MKKNCMLEKLLIRKGESSIAIIIIFSGILIFVLLPVVGIIFEKLLLEMLYQEVAVEIELNVYEVFQKIDSQALGSKFIQYDPSFREGMNEHLQRLVHPQLKSIEIKEIIHDRENFQLLVSMELEATLYRKTLNLSKVHLFKYTFRLPLDG